MRALLQGISCQGLGAERLLEKLKAAGVQLYDVRRQDAKTLCFYYESRDQERVSGLLQSLGFACARLCAPSCPVAAPGSGGNRPADRPVLPGLFAAVCLAN